MARKRAGLQSNGNPRPEALATLVAPQTQAGIEAILVGGAGWTRHRSKAPSVKFPNGMQVYMGDPTSTGFSVIDEENAWRRVLSFDDETAQTFLFAMARYLAASDDEIASGGVTITVNEILEYRGHARGSKRDFKPVVKMRERQRFSDLAKMHVTVPIKVEGRRRSVVTSPLLHVAVYSDGEEITLAGVVDELGLPYEFRVSLGAWAASTVERMQRRPILAKIMSYATSVPVEQYALRLALGLHFRSTRVMSIGDLLSFAKITVPDHHTGRFRERIEEALDRLVSDQIIKEWFYVDADEEALPRKGAIDAWRQWQIQIVEAPLQIGG